MPSEFPDFRAFALSVEAQLGKIATMLPPADAIASMPPDLPIERAEKIFKMLQKVELDSALKTTMLLPQELQLYWQDNDAMGELFLSSISGTCNRLVDPSQHGIEFFGAPLADYRIVDEVANVGGPFFTLIKKVADRLEEQLYFFDTRNCWKISISIQEYIDLAMKSFAPLYWQCLFIDEELLASRADALERSLGYLADKADDAALSKLRVALAKKRSG